MLLELGQQVLGHYSCHNVAEWNDLSAQGVPSDSKDFDWGSPALHEMFGNKFVYDKMWELAVASRNVLGSAKLEIVDIIQ